MKIFLTVLKLLSGQDFHLKFPYKIKVELRFCFSAHCHKVVYICTKFHENILDGIKVIEGIRFL